MFLASAKPTLKVARPTMAANDERIMLEIRRKFGEVKLVIRT